VHSLHTEVNFGLVMTSLTMMMRGKPISPDVTMIGVHMVNHVHEFNYGDIESHQHNDCNITRECRIKHKIAASLFQDEG
jgi:hypothetical protein